MKHNCEKLMKLNLLFTGSGATTGGVVLFQPVTTTLPDPERAPTVSCAAEAGAITLPAARFPTAPAATRTAVAATAGSGWLFLPNSSPGEIRRSLPRSGFHRVHLTGSFELTSAGRVFRGEP